MDTSPDVSPDGSRIAFASNRTGSFEIWRVDADGGNARQLTDFRTHCISSPLVAGWPANRILSPAIDRRPKSIYVLDASTGASRRITAGPSEDDCPPGLPMLNRFTLSRSGAENRVRSGGLPPKAASRCRSRATAA